MQPGHWKINLSWTSHERYRNTCYTSNPRKLIATNHLSYRNTSFWKSNGPFFFIFGQQAMDHWGAAPRRQSGRGATGSLKNKVLSYLIHLISVSGPAELITKLRHQWTRKHRLVMWTSSRHVDIRSKNTRPGV